MLGKENLRFSKRAEELDYRRFKILPRFDIVSNYIFKKKKALKKGFTLGK